MDNVERFINYTKIDTQSDEDSESIPSTEKQKNLGNLLVKELLELGLKDAHMDGFGNVYAHLPGEGKKIGLNAHMDTALEVSGKDVKARIIKNYDGGTINLNETYSMDVERFPGLKNHIGHDLIVTDGTTLLGGDDKAGIAIIMSVLDYLKCHPEVKHHTICVCFTCDEEIGRGPDHFDIKKMDADFAFTIDGSSPKCADYENFNAKAALINIKGVTVHPGEGRGKLINSLLVLKDVLNQLDEKETPYFADEDHGYWHLNNINGTGDSCSASMILRAFEIDEMEKRVTDLKIAVGNSQRKYPTSEIELRIEDSYSNMKQYVEKRPEVIEFANQAIKAVGLKPEHHKVRGGTDGATFSKMGLPTPNLGTGSYNHHGRFEYLDIYEYQQMIEIVKNIVLIK